MKKYRLKKNGIENGDLISISKNSKALRCSNSRAFLPAIFSRADLAVKIAKDLLFCGLMILVCSLLTFCEGQTQLSKEMPADVRMSYGAHAGMSPSYTNIEIEGDTLSFKEKTSATKNKEVAWTAKLLPEDKADLYRLFVENKFDQIVNEKNKSITYDAGSEGVSLLFGPNFSYTVQSGANFPLSSKNKVRYEIIAAEFEKLAKKYESMKEKPVEIPLEEARKQSLAFFEAIDTDKSGKTMYQAKFTPFFPTDWEGASQTKWVSYVYASGFEPGLADGERIAMPFAKIVYDPARQTAVLEKISGKLENSEIQGVRPLPKDVLDILGTGKDIEQILLQTKSRAELSSENTGKIIAFYKSWRLHNGVVFKEFADNHAEFNKWIDDGKN